MTESMQAYITATEKSIAQIQEMIIVEQEKRQALLDRELEQLESVLQRQQAMLMQTDSLEKRRQSAQVAAGFAQRMTGKEILATMPENEDRRTLELVFGRLGTAAEELRSLNKTALDIAQMNLKMMEHITRSAKEDSSTVYGATGRKGGGKTVGASFEEEI